MSMKEELKNPGLTATFIVRIEDVTEKVLSGVKDQNSNEGNKIMLSNIKAIEKAVIIHKA